MATDARFATGLPRHPKMLKLVRRLGQAGAWNFVCLVLWASENRSDGDLSDLSDEDIELAAEWDGAPGQFVATLVAVRFLDGAAGEYVLHDWADHNPWAAGSAKRSAKARWNAAKRHHGIAEADRMVPEYAAVRFASSTTNDATSNTSHATSKLEDATSETQHASSNAPSPSPSPYPSPNDKYHSSAKPTSTRFLEFWSMWPKSTRKVAKAECAKRWQARGLDAQADRIIANVQAMKATRQWRDGFEPAPLTYLNQRRWEDVDLAAPDAIDWWRGAGFENVHEAANAGCYEHNAAAFRDGKRIPEVA